MIRRLSIALALIVALSSAAWPSQVVQYSGVHTPTVDAQNRTGQKCMLPSAPTAGQTVFLAVAAAGSSAALPTAVYDNQRNSYTLITSNTSGSNVNVGLYAATVSLTGATAGVPNYPGGYLEPSTYFGAGVGISVCAFVANLGGPASSSTVASLATPASATSASPSVGPIAFTGNAVDIGVFGWYGASAGTIAAGSGYTLLYGTDYASGSIPGLAVVVKSNDSGGSATPSATLQNSVTWYGCGAAATAPGALITATVNTPNGIPALDLSSTYTFTVTGLNTAWTGSPFSVTGATLNSQTINSATSATLSVTAAGSRGTFTITDSSTGATVLPAGSHPLLARAVGAAASWYSSQYWYVSSSGNDSNSGTSSGSPFLTPGQAVTSAEANAYDVILLNGGNTFSIGSTLTPSVYLFWTSYGTGTATINTSVTTLDMMIETTNVGQYFSYLTVANTLASATSNYQNGNLVGNYTDNANHTDGWYVDHCTITGGMCGTGRLGSSTTGTTSGIVVTNCTVSGQFNIGIMSSWGVPSSYISDTHFLGNTVYNISGLNYSSATGYGIIISHVIATSGCGRAMANTVYNWGASSTGSSNGSCGIIAGKGDAVFIEGNAAYGCYYSNDSCPFDLDLYQTNSTIRYNFGATSKQEILYAYSCYYGNIYAWNLGIDSGMTSSNYGSIELVNSDRVVVYCNTMIGSGIGPALIIGGSGPADIFNNLLVASPGQPAIYLDETPVTGTYIDGNCTQSGPGTFGCKYSSTGYTTLSSWQSELSTLGLVIGGGAEAGPFASQFFDPDPYVNNWTAANIPAIAAKYAPIAGSAAAVTPLNFVSTYGSKCGIAAIEPFDLAGNSTNSPQAIGAVCMPKNGYPTNYDAIVMGLGPYAHYRLGEQSAVPGTAGRAYDIMWNEVPAAGANTPTSVSGIIPASARKGTGFNGTNQRLYQQLTGGTTATALTVSAWVNATSVTGTAIIATSDQSTGYVWSLRSVSGAITCLVSDTGGTTWTGTGPSFTTGSLQHLCFTWNQAAGGSMALYVNGVSQSLSMSGTNPTSIYLNGITIGGNYSGSTFNFTGTIEDVCVWNSALTGPQIQSIYNAGIQSPAQPASVIPAGAMLREPVRRSIIPVLDDRRTRRRAA